MRFAIQTVLSIIAGFFLMHPWPCFSMLLNDSLYLVTGLFLGGNVALDYVTTEMSRTTIPVVIGAVAGSVVAVTIIRHLKPGLGPAEDEGS